MPFLPAVSLHGEEKFLPMLRRIFFSLIPTNQQKAEWTEISKFLSYFPFSWGNTGVFQKRRIKQELFYQGGGRLALRRKMSAKKAGNLVTDFLLGVPLYGGGYSVVSLSVKPELE